MRTEFDLKKNNFVFYHDPIPKWADPGGTFEIVCCENTLLVPHLPANWRGLTGWSRGWQLATAALPTLCLPSLWRGQDIQNLSGDSSTPSLYTPASPDRRAPLTFTIRTRLLPGVGGDGERVPVQTTPPPGSTCNTWQLGGESFRGGKWSSERGWWERSGCGLSLTLPSSILIYTSSPPPPFPIIVTPLDKLRWMIPEFISSCSLSWFVSPADL